MRKWWFSLLLLFVLTGCIRPEMPAMPRSAGQPLPIPRIERVFLPVAAYQRCLASQQAEAMAHFIMTDPRQRRPVMICHPALVKAALDRARDMVNRNYWKHCDPDGVCPNVYARRAGCRLPVDYGINGNDIEDLGAGTPWPTVMFYHLSNSPSHAAHMFALNDGWVRQRHYGVAYLEAPGSKYGFYYVILIGECLDD